MPLVGFASALGALTQGLTISRLVDGTMGRVASAILLDAARRAHPRRTGATAGRLSVKTDPLPGAGVRLELRGSLVSMWTITGTRAHTIEPRNANALHWVLYSDGAGGGGGDAFAARVNHPGTKGHDWRQKVVYSARPQIVALGLETSRYEIKALAAKMRGM